jgi:hypothetical protein
MEIFNLHENFQKALQILPMTFHFVDSVIGKKVSSQNNINYQRIEKWTVFIVTGIYCKTYYVDTPICNEHHEQC